METITFSNADNNVTANAEPTPGLLNLFKCKCPRCRKGDMFQDSNPFHLKNTMKMNWIAATCTNTAFILLLTWKYFE